MTAKDFSFIAGVVSNLPREGAVRQKAAQEFADHLRVVNPRFNERLFMDACQVTQLTIPASRVKPGDFILSWGEVADVMPVQYADENGYELRYEIRFRDEDALNGISAYCLETVPTDPVVIERLVGGWLKV